MTTVERTGIFMDTAGRLETTEETVLEVEERRGWAGR